MQQNVTTIDEQVNTLAVQVRERLASELGLQEQIKNVVELVQQERTERLQEAEVVREHVKGLSAANERRNSETQRQQSEHRVAEKEIEKMMPVQEDALTTTSDIAPSSTDDFDHKTDPKENSLNRFNEELEMHRRKTQDALAQEMACRESGLNELHEKMHRSKMDVDNIARLLWDAIEMHTHSICIDDVVRAKGLEHLDIQQSATPGLGPAQNMAVARPLITQKQTARPLRSSVASQIVVATPALSWTPAPRIAVAAAPVNIVAPRVVTPLSQCRSAVNVVTGQVGNSPIPVTITRSSGEVPDADCTISL